MREFTFKNANLKFIGRPSGKTVGEGPRESALPAEQVATAHEAAPSDEPPPPAHEIVPAEEPIDSEETQGEMPDETPSPETPPAEDVQLEEESPRSETVQQTLVDLERALQQKQTKLERLCAYLGKIRNANTTLVGALKRVLETEFDLSEDIAAIREELGGSSRTRTPELEQAESAEDSLEAFAEAADRQAGNGAHPPDTQEAAIDQKSRSLLLQGTLDQLQVTEVLEFVRIHRKTGKITVNSEGTHGVIHLIKGEAVFASAGNQEGFPAFTALMDSVRGDVEFVSESIDEELTNLSSGTIPLMMDALRLLDERDSQLRR